MRKLKQNSQNRSLRWGWGSILWTPRVPASPGPYPTPNHGTRFVLFDAAVFSSSMARVVCQASVHGSESPLSPAGPPTRPPGVPPCLQAPFLSCCSASARLAWFLNILPHDAASGSPLPSREILRVHQWGGIAVPPPDSGCGAGLLFTKTSVSSLRAVTVCLMVL